MRAVRCGPAKSLLIGALACAPLASAAEAAAFEESEPFASGVGGYHTYRIPAVVATAKGAILAFAEGRKHGAGDSGDIDLLLRQSHDGGRTWEPVQVVVDSGPDTAGNPAPVVDPKTGTVWLLFSKNLGDRGEAEIVERGAPRTVWVVRSADGGATWSAPREITAQVKPPEWTWTATGPGHGIALRGGRLLVPCDHVLGRSRDYARSAYSHVIVSDDGGETWRLGGAFGPGTNECTAVEVAPDVVYANARNYVLPKRRAYAWSRDGGLTFETRRWDDALPEPVCHASAIGIPDPGGTAKTRILFANPASERRERLTVRLSDAEWRTWPAARVIHEGPAAYSDLVLLPSGEVGCLYERGEKSPYEKIAFARFDPAWVLGSGGPARPPPSRR